MVCSTMRVIGLMSGTSLDGLDLARVDFTSNEEGWKYTIVKLKTLKYSEEWYNRLLNSRTLSGLGLTTLHHDYGVYLGKEILRFLDGDIVDLISSHGHTVFHQPQKGFTLQIGSLEAIAAVTGVRTIGDFRTLDVAKGGQGAPLVPIGDELLFSEYTYCLNLGGISNISSNVKGERIAEDLSPCNIVSNSFMKEVNQEFDLSGETGREGNVDPKLLSDLNEWDYYHSEQSSLGIEDIEARFLPLFSKYDLCLSDRLRTYYEHLGSVIGSQLVGGQTLITGGGAKNKMLIECIRNYSQSEIVIPSDDLIDFKEAIIFALLGCLRELNQVNVLKSVTGASSDSVSGTVVLP